MMKRRIFPWMGLIVLFLSVGLSQDVLAKELYKVKRGDTLAKISRKTGIGVQDLKAANHMTSISLKSNQVLVIPREGKQTLAKARKASAPGGTLAFYVVRKGDTLSSISSQCSVSVNSLKRANHLRTNSLKIGQKLVLNRQPAKIVAAKAEIIPVKGDRLAQEEADDEEAALETEGDDVVDAEPNGQTESALLGKWSNPGERRLFVRVVMGFLGAPYRFGGSTVRGLDCSAFVKKIYQLFDVDLPRTAREQAHVGKCIARDNLEEGDLVFFNTRRTLGHVGIYIGNNEFIHASSRDRAVKIDSLDSEYYNKRFVKAVRVKELDSGA